MKTKSKALLMTLCAALLVAVSVLGTMAYLTSTDEVVNTFTVGKVAITLDEAKVDEDGIAVDPAERVKENQYKLMPGQSYTKDPTVHFAADSEDSYLFVKVENGIAAIEDSDNTIASQIEANGWTLLDGTDNVYYKEVTGGTAQDILVFGSFTVAGTVDAEDLETYAGANITVTAYAVQSDGFDGAKAAWDATFGA